MHCVLSTRAVLRRSALRSAGNTLQRPHAQEACPEGVPAPSKCVPDESHGQAHPLHFCIRTESGADHTVAPGNAQETVSVPASVTSGFLLLSGPRLGHLKCSPRAQQLPVQGTVTRTLFVVICWGMTDNRPSSRGCVQPLPAPHLLGRPSSQACKRLSTGQSLLR